MNTTRTVIGFALSVTLLILSIYNFTLNNSLSTESWGFLLLAPLPLLIVLAPNNNDISKVKIEEEWSEDVQNIDNENIDPLDFGYDIPIL